MSYQPPNPVKSQEFVPAHRRPGERAPQRARIVPSGPPQFSAQLIEGDPPIMQVTRGSRAEVERTGIVPVEGDPTCSET
jgi:hypothetical protein